MKRFAGVLAASYCVVASSAFAAFTVGSDTDTGGWIKIPGSGNYDYLVDQQTGQASGDIVGGSGGSFNNYDSGFYTNWYDGGTTNIHTDGTIGFRVRLDDIDNGSGGNFNGLLWVGIDANQDAKLDVFIGVNNSGNNDTIDIRAAGSSANTSPSTTSIANAIKVGNSFPYSFAETINNYSYRAVTAADGGTTLDITSATSGDTDYYVSFTVDFAQLVSFLNTQNNIQITDSTALRYVLGTATQDNSLNQDLGAVNGGVNSTSTWEQLGGFSPAMNATGTTVPEPSAALLGGLGLLGLLRRRRY
jgi:MYXO-CTERM domain-containing protein